MTDSNGIAGGVGEPTILNGYWTREADGTIHYYIDRRHAGEHAQTGQWAVSGGQPVNPHVVTTPIVPGLCDICRKPLADHSMGSGVPMCPGIAYPTYRSTLNDRLAAPAEVDARVEAMREVLEQWRLKDGYVPAYIAGNNAMLDKALELAAVLSAQPTGGE